MGTVHLETAVEPGRYCAYVTRAVERISDGRDKWIPLSFFQPFLLSLESVTEADLAQFLTTNGFEGISEQETYSILAGLETIGVLSRVGPHGTHEVTWQRGHEVYLGTPPPKIEKIS